MRIDRLFSKHIDDILALYKDNFPDGWNKNMLESAFEQERFIAIGIYEQNLIGIITCSTTEFDADVEGIVVDKEHRRKGYALLLLNALEEMLIKNKIEKIFLEVRKNNLPAKNLYLKNGYKEISVRKKYYSDGEDALIMAKEL